MRCIFFFIAATLMLINSSSIFAQPDIPSGWQTPIKSDYSVEDQLWFKGHFPNKANGDFNGDRIDDVAWLLVNGPRTKWSLFVAVSNAKNGHNVITLDEGDMVDGTLNIGISLTGPGTYQTACGKGYWDCDKKVSAKLHLTLPGIDLFQFESSNSIYYWDKRSNAFMQVWMSD